MLSELLDRAGHITIRPDERNLAYEREGLPATAILTRATSIKIGERAGADLIIVGTYRVDGLKDKETITVTARMVDIREGRIAGREFSLGGPLGDLQQLQGEIAFEILKERRASLPYSRDDIVKEATRIPKDAFSDYLKAVLTLDHQNKVLFLERAIETYQRTAQGQFMQAVFELGRVLYLDGKWADAAKWLSQIDRKYSRYPEASFYLGVAQAHTRQIEPALKTFTDLVPHLPLYEVYNNAGVMSLRANRVDDAITYLKPAAEAATRDADSQFNYGYALWMKQDYAGAAQQFENAVARRSTYGEAYYLLARCYERLGKAAEAQMALDNAKRTLPVFAQWETRQQIPDLSRLKDRFSKIAYYGLKKDARTGGAAGAATTSPTATQDSLRRARELFQANRDREALDELGALLQVTPDNHEAHLLRGRIFERRGEYDRAVEALKAAVFWNPKLLEAYVTLGRIYVFRQNCVEAQAASTRALQIDASNNEALALRRLVEQKCKN
jgi:tetratricopeptide (TPR) repeat protein